MESLARLQEDGNAWEEWHQIFYHIRMGDLDGAQKIFEDSFSVLNPPCAVNLREGKAFWKSAVFFIFLSFSNSNGQHPKEFPESIWKIIHMIERSQGNEELLYLRCHYS